jgi:hypothetical protein
MGRAVINFIAVVGPSRKKLSRVFHPWPFEPRHHRQTALRSQAQRSMQMLREMWINVEELTQTQNNLKRGDPNPVRFFD